MIKFTRNANSGRATATVDNVQFRLEVVKTAIAEDVHGSLVPSVEWSVSLVDGSFETSQTIVVSRILYGTVHVDNFNAAEEHVVEAFEDWLKTHLTYLVDSGWHNDESNKSEDEIPF